VGWQGVSVIESVELVVAALAAGAAAGARDAASTAVKDAYEGLKSLTRKALRRSDSAADEEGIAEVEAGLADPGAHRKELAAALISAGVEADGELVAAARRVLELVDPEGASAGKYQIVLRDNKGVQVGDHNTQTNMFNA
jgi:hypothetical protein